MDWTERFETWCYWERLGPNWIQWDMCGPWISDDEYGGIPRHYGPCTQCWLWLGEWSYFGMDCDLFLVFGAMGVRPVFWFGGNAVDDSFEAFGGDKFNTEWGYVHYIPCRDSLGGSPDVLELSLGN